MKIIYKRKGKPEQTYGTLDDLIDHQLTLQTSSEAVHNLLHQRTDSEVYVKADNGDETLILDKDTTHDEMCANIEDADAWDICD